MSKTLKREFPYPEHLQYWPYAEEQYSNTLITFERFKLWKNIIIGIIEFFEKIKYLDSCYSKQYSKLSSVLEPSESEYCIKTNYSNCYIYIYIYIYIYFLKWFI